MESLWSVAFVAVMVIGAGRVQERVDFLERLLRGELDNLTPKEFVQQAESATGQRAAVA